MDSRNVLTIIARLEADGIDVWLDGGWGVDALLEHQTREHDDLDIVVELEHASRVIELLDSVLAFLDAVEADNTPMKD
jgi:lincosamide nucleotidyltransferase A/C/D/E